MTFSWESVVKLFHEHYDAFCQQDQEENIFFDYAGVNAEGSSVGTDLRKSWVYLLLLDAILAYTEHNTRVMVLTQSMAFKYHNVLRSCIQKCKKESNIGTVNLGTDPGVGIYVPKEWTTVSALQQSLCTNDSTVSDILVFLISSPLLEDENDLLKLIKQMVNDVPSLDPPFGSRPNNNNIEIDSSSSPRKIPAHDSASIKVENLKEAQIKDKSAAPKVSFDKGIVFNWKSLVADFERRYLSFLAQGHSKLVFDRCDVSTHLTPAMGSHNDWMHLLLLDAVLCVFLGIGTRKRTAVCFNQHRILRECIQNVILQEICGDIEDRQSTTTHSRLDMSLVKICVTKPWDNILLFTDSFHHNDQKLHVPTKNQSKRSRRGTGVKREHTRDKVIQHLYWGISLPSLPSQHDSKVKHNLQQFCRTILALASNQEPKTDDLESYSLSTFCSTVLELEKHREHVDAVKRQRT